MLCALYSSKIDHLYTRAREGYVDAICVAQATKKKYKGALVHRSLSKNNNYANNYATKVGRRTAG